MIADRIPSARILIVDDEEANVELLERILEPAGYAEVFQFDQHRDFAADHIQRLSEERNGLAGTAEVSAANGL